MLKMTGSCLYKQLFSERELESEEEGSEGSGSIESLPTY